MFSAGLGAAWSQEASHARAAAGGRTASVVVRPDVIKVELALRKKIERARTIKLMESLEVLAPSVDENKGLPGRRSKSLRGRTKEELVKDVIHAVRLQLGQVLRSDDLVHDQREYTLPRQFCARLTPTPRIRPYKGRADGRGVLAQGRRCWPRTRFLNSRH